jgi:ribosomal protein S12 methylthiotransferase
VGLISLGCAKNLVDAEIMLGSLIKSGAAITNNAGDADVVIVNTCSFIDAAQEESIDAILESAELREVRQRGQGLIVAGCMPQRFREELPKLLPEVDAFMGIDQVSQIGEIVEQALAHRAAALAGKHKLQSSKFKVQGAAATANNGKHGITARLAALDASNPAASHAEKSLRGTEKFGQTKTLLEPATDALAEAKFSRRDPADVPIVHVNVRPHYVPDYLTPRFRLTPRHFAYLKIAEGCNHTCSFCTIPRMRGSHRSRAQNDIVLEARQLIADGVKELNLISQDSTYYGLDLRPNRAGSIAAPDKFSAAARALPANAATLSTLLRELNDLPGDFWIRLLYTHPAHWTDELMRTIAECPKVARYVDMPLQHIHDAMLERMRRETSRKYIVDLISHIRASIPGIALRTTFIVGFPGETETYFETLLNFIQETKFERLGVFTYSKEEGTRAGSMAGQIAKSVKEQRRERAMAAQLAVARQIGKNSVGRSLRVLVEKKADAHELTNVRASSWENALIRGHSAEAGRLTGKFSIARGEADAPDIDGRVYVSGGLPAGKFVSVKVISHTDYDLIAEPLAGSMPASRRHGNPTRAES